MLDFKSLQTAIQQATDDKQQIHQLVLDYERSATGSTTGQIMTRVRDSLAVMRQAVEEGTKREEPSLSGITGGESLLVSAFSKQKSVLGSVASRALAWGLAVSQVNAAMGKVVAAPTAGSCGIIPGALLAIGEEWQSSDEELCQALLTSSGIGMVIAQRASIAGATGGCQAECGSATAMAAGAIVELAGGSPTMVGHAVALALKSIMGLVCDPVAGLVEVPCIKRNGFGAVSALTAAELALAGVESIIPVDEVIDAMAEVGDKMPMEYKETSCGGLARTPTGVRLMEDLYGRRSSEQ